MYFTSVFQITLALAIASIVVPVAIMFLIFRGKLNLSEGKRLPLLLSVAIAYGVLLRLVMAPFTGHPQDLNYWTNPMRMFYGSGIVDIRLYPMPFTYYPVLFSYSPYAVLNILGFHDATFLMHNVGIVESLFVKLPFIVADIFSFYFLYKILGKLDAAPAESKPKRLSYALLFFLSPVLILSTTAWPLVDGISVALFLAGIYYSLLDDHPVLGAVFFTLSGITKVFGFLGFVPLIILLLKRKQISKLALIVTLSATIALMAYLPILVSNGVQGIPEFFMQFLRGRAGFGSQGFIASDSYFSYLSLLGYYFNPSYLTYLLVGLFGIVTVYYGLKVRKLDLNTQKNQVFQLSLLYFASFFFLFYLIFYRIYNYYYLLVLPLLIMYAYSKKLHGPLLAVVFLSILAAPITLLSCLVSGGEFYWITLNLPADPSIMSVVYSTIAAFAFLTILPLKGRLGVLKTGWGFSISTCLVSWFVFSAAFYGYYRTLFLGLLWIPISIAAILSAWFFFAKGFRQRGHEP